MARPVGHDVDRWVETGGRKGGSGDGFWKEGRWAKRVAYLGSSKKVFDAEVFAILRVVHLLREREEAGQEYTIFSDS